MDYLHSSRYRKQNTARETIVMREGLTYYIPASPQRSMKASRIVHFWSVSLVLEGVGDAFHLHLFSLPPTSSVCVGVVMAAE